MSGAEAAPPHPLDPLTTDELARIKSILTQSGRFSKDTAFSWIQLDEPAKKIVGDFKPGADFPRRAYVAAIDYAGKKAFDVIVDLRAGSISALTDLAGLQPGISDRDAAIARAAVDADPTIKAALIARGLRIPGKVSESTALQIMPVGRDSTLGHEGTRMLRVLFGSDRDATNDGPVLDGIMAVVDLYAGRVIRLIDRAGAPSPKVPHDIFRPDIRGPRVAANPVLPARPKVKNIAVDGQVVSWRQWQFRYGFNLREGLVLYQIGLDDGGRRRSIAYRVSVAEVLTAYNDGSDFWSWMEVFDESMFGLGDASIDVRPGREVPANAMTINPIMPDVDKPRFSGASRHRVYLYERDAGGLVHYRQGELGFHARATELVIGHMASVGNYVYGFNWVFRQDGSFAFEAELAGEIVTKFVHAEDCEVCKALAAGPGPDGASRTFTSSGDDKYGTLVHPRLVGINHQHWFNLRLDFDVDGVGNAVMENNLAQAHQDGRPREAAAHRHTVAHTVFGKARDAKRDTNEETARTWTIYNPSSLRRSGRPAGYTVVPIDNTSTLFAESLNREAVGFSFHHFWTTPYRDGQLYAGGAHPNQAGPNYADTLYNYADDEAIYDRDIVVWYSLGETHLPRPEDYPIMTNTKLSVVFRPDGFFERNPALSVGEVLGK